MANTDTNDSGQEAVSGEQPSQVQILFKHAQENPLLYLAAFAFIALIALVTTLYRVNRAVSDSADAAVYARALDMDDPLERAMALSDLADSSPAFAARALYLQGESYIVGDALEDAVSSFTELRERFPDFEFTPDAVEGLGFIEESKGNYAEAVARYEEVVDKWPGKYAARRQPMNIGRCQERNGNLEAAVGAYQRQLEVFPGSIVSQRAQFELDRLRASRPDLFPDDSADVLLPETAAPSAESLPSIDISADPGSD